MWHKVLLVAIGGGLGAVARYAMALLAIRLEGVTIVAGTVAANAIGCLIFGFVFGLASAREALGQGWTLLLLAGFCGALTTFSTYAFELQAYARDVGLVWAGGYLVLQNVLGLSLVLLGLWIGQWVAG